MRTDFVFAPMVPITLALVLGACSVTQTDEASETAPEPSEAAETPMPVEPDGGIGDGAPPLEDLVLGQESGNPEEVDALPQSFPTAIRGTWRATDGAKVTAAQCDNTVSANMGKVLTVRADSYSFFETGGRFIEVTAREPGRIRAVFDTTYADEPTRDELEFRVDPVARTLTVENFDAGEQGTTTYRRCPLS